MASRVSAAPHHCTVVIGLPSSRQSMASAATGSLSSSRPVSESESRGDGVGDQSPGETLHHDAVHQYQRDVAGRGGEKTLRVGEYGGGRCSGC